MISSNSENISIGKNAADKVLSETVLKGALIPAYEIARNFGFSVFIADFENTLIAGYLDCERRRIVVSREDGTIHQNFTIANGLARWIINKNEVINNEKNRIVYRKAIGQSNNPIDIQADAFAACLLIPEDLLQQHRNKNDADLSRFFDVPQSSIEFRREIYYG